MLEADFANSKILLFDQKCESKIDRNCRRDSLQRNSRHGNKTIASESSSRSVSRTKTTKSGLPSNFQDISRIKVDSSDFNFSKNLKHSAQQVDDLSQILSHVSNATNKLAEPNIVNVSRHGEVHNYSMPESHIASSGTLKQATIER